MEQTLKMKYMYRHVDNVIIVMTTFGAISDDKVP